MLRGILTHLRSDLAVDLGTTNTLVGVLGEGLVIEEPSVVAVEQRTGRILSGGCAVGRLAQQMLGRTGEAITVVRPLRNGVITDFELCEAMLRYYFRKAQQAALRLRPRVLVAVPGCITPVEKRAVFGSALRAGAGEVLLVGQAKAAAIGAGLPIAEPVASMVCDVGGGTTEVAVISLSEVVSGQSIPIGGDAMDRAIADYLRRHHSLRIGLPTAERLRMAVGSAWPQAVEGAEEVRGIDAISGLPRRANVTGEEVREALLEPIEAILDAVKAALDGCGPELAADLVDNGIVLCGGGSQLRGMDRYLAEQTGLPVRMAAAPLTTVAAGALICLEHLEDWRPSLESSDDL